MSEFFKQLPLILASSSTIREKLLKTLGIKFTIVPSNCDEDAIKMAHQSDSILDLGFALAKDKALNVSKRFPDEFVIAADQLCVIDDKILDKPLNHQTAIEHLRILSGNKHEQIACLCIAKDNKILWQYHDIATVTLHHLSEESIEHYLQCEKPYHSCGAYQYESQGKWLFKEVQGKEDTILGLPLIPLANALISLGAVTI